MTSVKKPNKHPKQDVLEVRSYLLAGIKIGAGSTFTVGPLS